MNPSSAVIVIAVALGVLAVVVNQIQARLALVEVTLTEGLPPGHRIAASSATTGAAALVPAQDVLSPGVHIFVSRSCHACQRLVEEMEHAWRPIDAAVSLRYVDRPRPFARELASQLGLASTEHDRDMASAVGADPLPYTIAVGDHDLVARNVTPTVHQVQDTARDAGLRLAEGST